MHAVTIDNFSAEDTIKSCHIVCNLLWLSKFLLLVENKRFNKNI